MLKSCCQACRIEEKTISCSVISSLRLEQGGTLFISIRSHCPLPRHNNDFKIDTHLLHPSRLKQHISSSSRAISHSKKAHASSDTLMILPLWVRRLPLQPNRIALIVAARGTSEGEGVDCSARLRRIEGGHDSPDQRPCQSIKIVPFELAMGYRDHVQPPGPRIISSMPFVCHDCCALCTWRRTV